MTYIITAAAKNSISCIGFFTAQLYHSLNHTPEHITYKDCFQWYNNVKAQLADLERDLLRKGGDYAYTNLGGGAWKNSPQAQYSEGFHYDGDMTLQDIEVGATDWTSEDEIGIVLTGRVGQDSNLRQLYFRLPRDPANALARAILSYTELRVPQIRLRL